MQNHRVDGNANASARMQENALHGDNSLPTPTTRDSSAASNDWNNKTEENEYGPESKLEFEEIDPIVKQYKEAKETVRTVEDFEKIDAEERPTEGRKKEAYDAHTWNIIRCF